MIDWDQVLQRITEMHEYFRGCLDNAAPGSEAEKRFGEYCGALFILELAVRGRIAEGDDNLILRFVKEDDGK